MSNLFVRKSYKDRIGYDYGDTCGLYRIVCNCEDI